MALKTIKNWFKRFWAWCKRQWKNILRVIFGVGLVYAVGAEVPIMPVELKWIGSYETLQFNTPSGDMEIGYYALTDDKDGYFIRTKPQDEFQFERVGFDYDISGLKKVKIIGVAYYDEFQDEDRIHRIRSTSQKYNGLRYTKNFPQPVFKVRKPLFASRDIEAAIGYDTTTNSGGKTSVSSYSWSHTVAAGVDLVLLVGVGRYDSTDADRIISSVTYNGDALTSEHSENDGGDNYTTDIMYLANPDSGGSYAVAVTLSGIMSGTSAGAISFSGVNQSTPFEASSGGQGYSQTMTDSITTLTENAWIMSSIFCNENTAGDLSVTVGTERWEATSGSYSGGGATRGPLASTGSYAITWYANTFSRYYTIAMGSIKPSANKPVITNPIMASLDNSSTTLKATIDMNDATTTVWGFFEYGTSAAYGATTTGQALNASTTYTEGVSGLSGFTPYYWRAGATSTISIPSTVLWSYSDTGHKFYPADVSTSTYQATEWNAGTMSTTTVSGTTVILTANDIALDTESFEVDDGDWVDQACTGCTSECWVRGNLTGSGSTGPATNHGAEGSNYFQFWEASSGYCFDLNDEDTIEYSFATTSVKVEFWYHMYGSGMGTLYVDAWASNAWTNIWSISGQQHAAESDAWTQATTSLATNASKVRFRGKQTVAQSYFSDMAFDIARVLSSYYNATGTWVSLPISVDAIDYVDDSQAEWTTTTPANTGVNMYSGLSEAAGTPPTSWDEIAESGDTIASATAGTDLTGKYLWIKAELYSTDGASTPNISELYYGVNDGTAPAAEAAGEERRVIYIK